MYEGDRWKREAHNEKWKGVVGGWGLHAGTPILPEREREEKKKVCLLLMTAWW